jgi:hypothetical protein
MVGKCLRITAGGGRGLPPPHVREDAGEVGRPAELGGQQGLQLLRELRQLDNEASAKKKEKKTRKKKCERCKKRTSEVKKVHGLLFFFLWWVDSMMLAIPG